MTTEAARATVTVLDAGPELTMETAHELLRRVRALSAGSSLRVVVDMRRTRTLDSTGVGALVSSMRYVRQQRGVFALSRLSPEVQQVFHVMNLGSVLTVCDTLDAATRCVTAEPPRTV